MRDRFFGICLVLLALSVSGCGGGGGSGGAPTDSFSVSSTSLSFSAAGLAATPASQNITATVSGSDVAAVGAAYRSGVTPAAWLTVTEAGSLPNFTFTFTVNTTTLDAGTYSTTVSLGAARADGSIIAYKDVAVTYKVSPTLAVSTNSLAFTAVSSGPAPATQTINLTSNGAQNWTASADKPWVTLGATSGTTAGSAGPSPLDIGINPAGLAPGPYTSTITISNGTTSNPVTVNLTVQAPSLAPTLTQLAFSGTNGSTIAAQSVGISLTNAVSGGTWTATAADGWVQLSKTSGTLPDTLNVSVNPAIGPLASGAKTSSITFSTTAGGTTLTATVQVNLALTKAVLTANPVSIDVGGTDGSSLTPATFAISLNTGTNAFAYTSTAPVTGSTVSPATGTLSATPANVTVTPLTTVAGNTYSGSVTFSATVNGDIVTQQVPIVVHIKPHRLFVADTGIALVDTPTTSKLSRSIIVRENRNLPVTWTAASDQPWLTVTPSGSGNGTLTLTADPSSLPMEAVSLANVTVSSSTPGIVNSGQEVIRVGLYRTAATPAAQAVNATLPNPNKVTGMVADSVRPYVYVSHGGNTVDVFNVYSAALVKTLDCGTTCDLRALEITRNGDWLYAADMAQQHIVVFDLTQPSLSPMATWSDPVWQFCSGCTAADYMFPELDFTRVNGKPVLIGTGIDFLDATTGARLAGGSTTFFAESLTAVASGSGALLFTASTLSSGFTLARQTLTYDELNTALTVGTPLQVSGNSTNRGQSTDYDGLNVYEACWYPNQLQHWDGTTLATISSIPTGSNGGALLGPDGLVYCARYYDGTGINPSGDVWAVDSTSGVLISGKEWNVAGEIADRQYTFSGDGMRLITRSNSLTTLTSTAIAP